MSDPREWDEKQKIYYDSMFELHSVYLYPTAIHKFAENIEQWE